MELDQNDRNNSWFNERKMLKFNQKLEQQQSRFIIHDNIQYAGNSYYGLERK